MEKHAEEVNTIKKFKDLYIDYLKKRNAKTRSESTMSKLVFDTLDKSLGRYYFYQNEWDKNKYNLLYWIGKIYKFTVAIGSISALVIKAFTYIVNIFNYFG